MGLHGSLEVFGLVEVLGLLAATGQSGRLHVQGPGGGGTASLHDGAVVAATAARTDRGRRGPAAPLPEALAGLMGDRAGSFRFDAAEVAVPADAPAPRRFEDLMTEAAELRREWDGLLGVCPDLDDRLHLVDALPGADTTIDAGLWPAVAMIGARRPSVGELAGALGTGELGALRIATSLLRMGVARLDAPVEVARVAS
jgi:hypothetical protein